MPVRISPIVQHPSLKSTITGLWRDDKVISYLGVPYGVVTKRWTYADRKDYVGESFDATTHGPKCPQETRDQSTSYGPRLQPVDQKQNEFECLNLNIFRPAVGTALPILVWIHGGAFLMGSASEPIADPARLVAWSVQQGRPIMVIAINSRLGPFGFLYSSDLKSEPHNPPYRGNFGLHDQRVALEWIQRHVAGFGGDPRRVTIAGQSSGGYAIHAHIAADTHLSSQPSLFSRAIVHSGPLAPRHIWSIARLDRIWAKMLGSEVFSSTTEAERVEALRSIGPEELIRRAVADSSVGTWGVFADGVFVSPKLYDSVWRFKTVVPRAEAVMVGDCADERSVFIARARSRGIKPLFDALKRELSLTQAPAKLAMYGLTSNSNSSDPTVVDILSHLAQDLRYLAPTDELSSSWPGSARYHMSLPNPFPESKDYGLAHHAVDLIYLFRNCNDILAERGLKRHLKVSDEMGEAWLKFIYGEEPWKGAEEGVMVHFSKAGMRLIKGGEDVRENEIQAERLAMWKEIGMVKVGRIANLWMSEQDSRGEVEFVY